MDTIFFEQDQSTHSPKLHAHKHDSAYKHDIRSVFLAILHM